jgi:hypothetical protein
VKNVRPVVLLSFKNLGGRGEDGLVRLITTIIGKTNFKKIKKIKSTNQQIYISALK